MKNRIPFLFVLAFLAISMFSNSCKKDNQGSVESLLARGSWQLASVMVYNYIGSNNVSTDTFNTKCALDQFFTFKTDGTCTYNDFSCIQQSTQGRWALSEDKLTMLSDMKCQDTAQGKIITSIPFDTARIVNVGQYSLVIETGDISSFYLSTAKRHVKRYGFIRN